MVFKTIFLNDQKVTLAHPSVIQVSDRFHLLKNLTDYCKDYLKNKFKSSIIVSEEIKSELSSSSKSPSIEIKSKHLKIF